MSAMFKKLCELAQKGEAIMSGHAFDKARRRGIIGSDIIDGIAKGILVEDRCSKAASKQQPNSPASTS